MGLGQEKNELVQGSQVNLLGRALALRVGASAHEQSCLVIVKSRVGVVLCTVQRGFAITRRLFTYVAHPQKLLK